MKQKNILDVGCGIGRTIPELSEKGNYYGIDTNKEYVKYCKKIFRTQLTLKRSEK